MPTGDRIRAAIREFKDDPALDSMYLTTGGYVYRLWRTEEGKVEVRIIVEPK